MKFQVSFSGSSHPPVELPADSVLSETLDIENSPILFGCRTGICGTCLVEVERGAQALTPPNETEAELLSIIAEDRTSARLCCQLKAETNLTLRYLGPHS